VDITQLAVIYTHTQWSTMAAGSQFSN